MEIFLSLVIFALCVYLFFITNNKIKNIKENILIEDVRKEMQSLIAEFNGAAVRNIELLEAKITELQDWINRANSRIVHLDGKIERANKPMIIERIVENIPEPKMEKPKKEEKPIPKEVQAVISEEKLAFKLPEMPESPVKAEPQEKEAVKTEAPKPEAKAEPAVELSRSEQLKKHLQDGMSREELMRLGYMENEINLLAFLIKKKS